MEHRLALLPSMHLFLATKGIEVLENLRKVTPDGQVDLEADIKYSEDQLKRDLTCIFVVGGKNGVGKGKFGEGVRRVLKQDLSLNRYFQRRGIEFDVFTIPLSMMKEFAKRKEAPDEFRIPENITPANIGFEESHRISKYQWQLFNAYIRPRMKNPKLATAVIVEGSTPIALPTTKTVPVSVEGYQDLGMSTFCNFALDPEVNRHTRFYLLDRDDDRVLDDSLAFRQNAMSKEDKLQETFSGNDRAVFTLANGREVEVEKLPLESQRQIRSFLSKTFASPEAVIGLDKMLEEWKLKLVTEGKIIDTGTVSYFDYIGRMLGLERDFRFSILSNGYLGGRKTADLDYFFDSLPARLDPGILAPVNLVDLRAYRPNRERKKAA